MNAATHRLRVLLGTLLLSLAPALAGAAVGRTPGTAWVTPAGAAAYSVPLALPPGTAGLTPALSLEYRHDQPGGLLGAGWSLGGLSAVSRCPRTLAQDGAPAPVQYSTQDRFCLDGQRLVVVNGVAYGAAGSEYRTEVESYARIRAFGSAGAGPQHFTVEAPDGRIYEYGTTADSRIDAGGRIVAGIATPRSWALSRIRDRAGNVIDFQYEEDTAQNGYRLAALRYGANPSLGLVPSHAVQLSYESRPSSEVDLTYVAGTPIRYVVRLDRIDVLHEGRVVRRYDLAYEPALSSAGRSRLASLQECGLDGADCLAPTTMQWQDGVPGLGAEVQAPLPLPPEAAWGDQAFWITADVNGDGLGDVLWTSGATGAATLRYRLGTPTGLGPEANTGIVIATPGVPFDYNGDGRKDLLNVATSGRWLVIPGTSAGPGAPVVTALAAPSPVDFRGADVNGDGLDDIVWSEIVGVAELDLWVRAYHARPGGSFATTPVTLYEQSRHAGYQGPEGGRFLGQPGQRIDLDRDGREDLLMDEDYSVARITAAEVSSDHFDGRPVWPTPVDLNGDGCTDLVYHHYTGYWRARFSGCAGPYWAAPEVQGPPGPASARPVVLDWNGDGKRDLLLRDAASWQLLMSGGDRLLPLVATGLAHGGATSQAVADVDGDGMDDLLARASGQLRLRLHRGPRPDLLAGVSDGFEVAASFAYAPITRPEAYTPLTGALYPQREWRDARAVVVAMSTTDGSGTGTRSTQTFAYEGLREDAQGRGSLGFARRIVTVPVGGETLRTEEAWRQDFPFTGLLRTRVIRRASGRVVADSAWEYAQLTLGSGAAARRYPYVKSSTASRFEAGGAYDGALHTTLGYSVAQLDPTSGAVLDASWTTTEQGTGLNTGASRTQRLWLPQVLNDVSNWCLGRPTSAQLTQSHTLPGGEPLTRTASASWDGLRCRPTQHQAEPGSQQWQLTTALGYDAFGNVASVAITGAGMATRTTRIDWGARGSAPASITDPLSQVERLAWEPGRGLLLSFTDANGLATSWTYDALGRPQTESRPDGTRRVLALSACMPAADCGQANARYRLRASEQSPAGATEWFEEWAFDRFDRWVVHREQQASGALSARTRSFDARGRLQRENLPHWTGAAAPGYLEVAWDVLDRPVRAGLYSAAGAAQRLATFERRGLSLTRRDAVGRASTTVSTAWGDPASVTDAAGGSTRYRHDAAGRLLQVTDAYGGVLTSLTWNPRGMKLAQTDVDLGARSFTPNALGELVSVRNARGQVTRFTFDALSRPLTRVEPEGTTRWTWGRPADNTAGARVAGRLLQVAAPGYAEHFAYDALARPVKRSIVADATYEYDLGYDALGRPDSLRYPASAGGYRLRLGYEYAYGHLRRIRDHDSPATTFWRLEAVDAAGQLLDETRGGSLRVITGVSPVTGEVEYRQSGVGSGAAVQNLAWRWDAQGNLIERSDLNAGVTERFTYDALDRLDDVRRNGVLALDVAYDLAGNITSRSDVGSYAYHATRRHAVTAAGSHRYGYDASGNMTSRDGRPVNWSSYDLPITVDGADGSSSTFWYGPDRQRWRQVASTAGGFETTIYAGGLLEKATRGPVTTWKHYVATPGGVAALHARSSDGQAPRTWLLTQDALGSTDRVVDAAGKVVLATSFDAFGSRRGPAWSGAPAAAELDAAGRTTRDGFTGHEQLDHLGLVHMGGRVYDPVIGRFLSADPVVQAPFWSQDLNRYSYAWNNPLSIVDPSGYAEEIPCLMDQGRCAQVTVYGLRDDRGLGGLQGSVFGTWMRAGYNGQAASAWERDPCGQDGSADACRLGTRTLDRQDPTSPVAPVTAHPVVEVPPRGVDYYIGKTVEWIGYTLIAFDLANTATGVLVGPDTSLLGGPLVAAAVQLRQGAGGGTKALQTYWPPDRGFMGLQTRGILRPGTRIDRFGSELGKFASPAGTPFGARALPPHAARAPLRKYEVLQPLPVRSGTAAPWFGQPGGGIQYEFADPIETLIQQGFLRRIP